MAWLVDDRYIAGGYWRCRVQVAAAARKRYAERPNGIWYNRKLLLIRRQKAMVRRHRREATA
jgi:hypothetical protein